MILWVGVVDQLFEFSVEFRQGLKENLGEVVGSHFDLIEYLRAHVAHGVGAPQEGDRAFQGVLPLGTLSRGHIFSLVVLFEQSGELS